jgi:hypothetical protein
MRHPTLQMTPSHLQTEPHGWRWRMALASHDIWLEALALSKPESCHSFSLPVPRQGNLNMYIIIQLLVSVTVIVTGGDTLFDTFIDGAHWSQ